MDFRIWESNAAGWIREGLRSAATNSRSICLWVSGIGTQGRALSKLRLGGKTRFRSAAIFICFCRHAATSITAVLFPPPTFKESGGAEIPTYLNRDAPCYFNVFTNSAIAPACVSSIPEMLLL